MQKIGLKGLYIFFIFSILFQLSSQAQSKKYFVITGKIVPDEVEGSTSGSIEVTKNGTETSTIEIPKNGRFRFELEFFNNYSLKFIYPGHFNKIIDVSTEIPQEVWERDNDFPPFPMIVQLTKEFPGIDKSFTLKASGRIFYGKDIDNFEKESYVSDFQFLEQVKTAQSQASQVQKEAQGISKEDAQDLAAKQKSFDQLIKEGDTHYQRSEYQMALMKYLEAHRLFPEKSYPNDRVAELQDLVKALEITEKQRADLEQKYKNAIAKADDLFNRKSYPEARPGYTEAMQFKPGDVYSTGRINEIDQLLARLEKEKQFKDLVAKADNSFKSKNYDQAITLYNQAKQISPEEQYPQDQITLIAQERAQQAKLDQLEKDFNQTMLTGTTQTQQKDFANALNTYKKALELKPDSKLAKDKIAETELAMVVVENDKKYQQAILLADQALAARDFERAKLQYKEALNLKSNEQYPNSKLAEIAKSESNEIDFNNLLTKAEKYYNDNDLSEALNSFNQALAIKPLDAAVKKRIDDIQNLQKQQVAKKEFADLIVQADQAYKNDQFEASLAAYNRALLMNSSDAYPKQQIQLIESYLAAIKKADKSLISKDYMASIGSYKDALALKSNDAYASGKVSEVEKILDEKKKQEEKEKSELLAYNEAIQNADNLFSAQNYAESLNKYKDALALKNAENYPKKRIKEIEGIMDDLAKVKAKKDKEYLNIIAQADKLLDKQDYNNAQNEYRNALNVKPEETYPQEQIKKIDAALAEKMRQEEENLRQQQEKQNLAFNEAMASADKSFAANDFSNAKSGYQSALTIKPNDPVAKEKLGQAEAKMAQIARMTKAYNDAITEANKQLSDKKYLDAKGKYQEALQYLPDSDYPKRQIAKIDEVLTQQETEAKTRRDFDKAVSDGESLAKSNELIKAKESFLIAYNLIPSEPVPPKRIKEIDALLAERLQKESELKAKMDAYNDAVQRADKLFNDKEYNSAKLAYSEALVIKSDEKYPQDQLDLIDRLLREQNEQNYKSAIAKADNALNSNLFDDATTAYQEALKIKNNDQYATGKIQEIARKKAEIEAENSRLKALDEQYKSLIADADNDFRNNNYPDSKVKYQKASDLKPTEAYPKDQIRRIDETIAELKRKEDENLLQQQEKQNQAYNEAIANGDKAFTANEFESAKSSYQNALTIKENDKLAKDKLGQTEAKIAQISRMTLAYNTAITEANKQLTDKKYPEAKEKYQEALQYLPDSDYPKRQIAKIDELLNQQEAEAKLKRDFDAAVAAGEVLFKENDLPKAKASFLVAYNLIPSESLPPKRIQEIDGLIAEKLRKESELSANLAAYQDAIKRADNHFANKEYNSAQLVYNEALLLKPDEKYPVDQLALIARLIKELNDLNYKTAIAKADNAFNSNQFDDATTSYQEALKFKKDDVYATSRLKEIVQKLADLDAENNRLKKIEDQYKNLITDATNDFNNKQYPVSKGKYQQALGIKPNETYPKEQIAKIDQILGDQQKAEDLNKQYEQLIVSAQDAFGENKLKDARDLYQKAYNLKPFEPMPPMRIAQIDAMLAKQNELAQLTAMEEAQRLAKEKADKLQYDNEIAAGDQSFASLDYRIAKMHYVKALTVMPNEQYPKDQISKIEELLAREETNKSLAQQKAQQDSLMKAKNKLFDQTVSAAKEHEQNKRYEQAIQKYKEAIAIKPDQSNSMQQYIKDIEDKLQLMAKQNLEYQRIIKFADDYFAQSKLNDALTEYRNAATVKPEEQYPKTQIQEIQSKLNAIEQSYTNAIARADKAFDASDWESAKSVYTEALGFKPNEAYPQNRLREVNQKIADAALAAVSNSAENNAYKEAMEKAEKAFKDDQLTNARMQYQVAQTLKPDEKLPGERIKEIDALIDQRNKDRLANAQKEIDEKYRQAISVADNSFREKSYSIAKLQYQQALIIKPNESYPKSQMALIDKLLNEAKPVETYEVTLTEMETAKPVSKPVYNPAESAQATEARAVSFTTINNYDEAVKKADGLFAVKDYAVARFYYYKANEIKPEEAYPKDQIEAIRKIFDSQMSDNELSGYYDAIGKADAAFSLKNYTVAKFYYYKAIDIKSWEKYPKDRINEILALTNSLLSEKEEKEYRDILSKADEAYFNKDLAIARFYYNKAIAIKKDENYPRIKLKDIQKLIEQDSHDQENEAYRKLIAAGDQALQLENFSIARFNYNKALTMKPNEKYPIDQLKKIKESLAKPNY